MAHQQRQQNPNPFMDTPTPELQPEALRHMEASSSTLTLQPMFALRIGPCPFQLRPKPTPEHELRYEDRLVLTPELVHDLSLELQYHGPRLTPQTETALVTKIVSHMKQAYKEAATQLGMEITERSGELILTLHGKPLDFTQRLNLENQMQHCFNQRAAVDKLAILENGHICALNHMLRLQPEPEPLPAKMPQVRPTPFRTRFLPSWY